MDSGLQSSREAKEIIVPEWPLLHLWLTIMRQCVTADLRIRELQGGSLVVYVF